MIKIDQLKINFQYPQPGELAIIRDYGCDRNIDEVKLHGVKVNIPFHRLSSEDQRTSSQIVNGVSYKLKH